MMEVQSGKQALLELPKEVLAMIGDFAGLEARDSMRATCKLLKTHMEYRKRPDKIERRIDKELKAGIWVSDHLKNNENIVSSSIIEDHRQAESRNEENCSHEPIKQTKEYGTFPIQETICSTVNISKALDSISKINTEICKVNEEQKNIVKDIRSSSCAKIYRKNLYIKLLQAKISLENIETIEKDIDLLDKEDKDEILKFISKYKFIEEESILNRIQNSFQNFKAMKTLTEADSQTPTYGRSGRMTPNIDMLSLFKGC